LGIGIGVGRHGTGERFETKYMTTVPCSTKDGTMDLFIIFGYGYARNENVTLSKISYLLFVFKAIRLIFCASIVM